MTQLRPLLVADFYIENNSTFYYTTAAEIFMKCQISHLEWPNSHPYLNLIKQIPDFIEK